jgi:hypothetical protein
MFTHGVQFGHEPAEIGVHFRRATGDIDGVYIQMRERRKTFLHSLSGHDLPAVRSGVDMTVGASLITHFSNVDLEYLDVSSGKWRQSRIREFLFERRNCRPVFFEYLQLTLRRSQRVVPELKRPGHHLHRNFLHLVHHLNTVHER